MKKNVSALLLILLIAGTASATTFNATLTADNHYALYYGNETEGIKFVGRNEIGYNGNPGVFNWSMAESFTFNIDPGDYIYVAGWSDDSVAQGWIGQFISDNETILTNSSHWEYLLTNQNLNDGSPAPTVGELTSSITGASWKSNPLSMDHGTGPWGNIAGISADADWIWGSSLLPGSGEGEYQIFRTMVAPEPGPGPEPVPEPATMVLLGAGLASLAGLKRKKNN